MSLIVGFEIKFSSYFFLGKRSLLISRVAIDLLGIKGVI